MKVLQLISSAGLYGAERVVLNLTAGLIAAGCEVTIGTLETDSPRSRQFSAAADAEGFRVKPIYCRGRLDISAVRELRNFVLDNSIDVIHTHGYKADLYAYAAAHGRCKLLATIHSREPIHRSVRLYTVLDGWVLRRFDQLLTVSNDLRERLLKESFSAEKVTHIPNGVPIPPIRKRNIQETPIVGFVGRLSHEKGPDVALQVFDLLNKRGVKFRGVFLGEGEMGSELQRKAEQLGVGRILQFRGYVANVSERLAEFVTVLMPSRSEQMPMALLEAMAAGKAVVATRVGSIGTIVENGVTGYLVNPGDVDEMARVLEFVLQNPAVAEKVGQQARAIAVEKYSSDVMVGAYLQAYRGCAIGEEPALQSIRTEGVRSNG